MLEKWLENPSALTVTGVLIALIVALVRETLVPGVSHRALIAEKDKAIAKLEAENDTLTQTVFRLLGMNEKVTQDLARRVV